MSWLSSVAALRAPGTRGRGGIQVLGTAARIAALFTLAFGCDTGSKPAASQSPAAATVSAAPGATAKSESDKAGEYRGPFATVRGRVRITGDEAPHRPDVVAKIPKDCLRARTVYERVFREGVGRAAVDVLVSATGYSQVLPPAAETVVVGAQGCAWNSRTVALSFGQSIEVESQDDRDYLPELLGNPLGAQFVAPKGRRGLPIKPRAAGRYVLTDSFRPFMAAEVFVLNYSTTAVTGLDGSYVIARVPPGKLTVTAFQPQILKTAEKALEVEAGRTYEVDFDIAFSLKEYQATAGQ
jgi:hypothetical protein